MAEVLKSSFTLEKAIELATQAHEGQLDKSGQPYIGHPINVMNQLQGDKAKMTGILHDVVEDSTTSPEDLQRMGCPAVVVTAIKLVTHPAGYSGTEEEYIEGIQNIARSGNQLAIDVKYADLTHNSDTKRILRPSERDVNRLEKYRKSMGILKPYVSKYLLDK